ncbi:MAG: hypothetical protein OHK0021_16980 [Bryobacter sp.]
MKFPDPMNDIELLLERFRRGGELLAAVTTGAAGAELDFKGSDFPLSVRETIWLLADSEAMRRADLSRLLAEDRPQLLSIPSSQWAARLGYQKRKLSVGVELFRTLRQHNHELLKDLSGDDWQRSATLDGTPTTLAALLESAAAQTETMALQVRELRQAYKAAKAAAANNETKVETSAEEKKA